MGDGVADVFLTGAGAGDGAGAVIGVGAGADDGRVSDAAKLFAGEAAGGGAGGDVALGIERHAADGAKVVGVVFIEKGLLSLGLFLFPFGGICLSFLEFLFLQHIPLALLHQSTNSIGRSGSKDYQFDVFLTEKIDTGGGKN